MINNNKYPVSVKTKNKKKVGAKVKSVTREDFEKSL